jgi:hypothetical protein
MMLNEENHVELINSYTREDWQPLLELIPQSDYCAGKLKCHRDEGAALLGARASGPHVFPPLPHAQFKL